VVSFNPLRLFDPRVSNLPPAMIAAFAWPGSLTSRTFRNPRLRSVADLAKPEFRVVEVPAGGGIGTARSIARLYGDLALGGSATGWDEATFAEVTAPARMPSKGPLDVVLKVDASYSLGWIRPQPLFPFGTTGRAFGHPGAGGSFGFADPDAELGFAYTPNRLGYHLVDDPRERALREAVYRSLAVSG
jgi:CubicO group peptidase (beta-lactamase class C family)